MWLLSTNRAELHFFPTPDSVTGGYAILSHTWGADEQTLQDIRAIGDRGKHTGENPRDLVTPKIRNCCIAALRHGYRWVWIDTCCIDKTSSTELSEAINSMFRWYSFSEVCYALLEDVPTDDDLHAPGSAFRKARWHTRGWTLQELIAPAVVIFMSRDWEPLGDKVTLAPLLAQITGVRREVLKRDMHHFGVSVAQRMSWVAKRNTTRVEDEAYCLMGLFNIYMPAIYGEGRRAFSRLQEEIMKTSFDTSIFAWGQWTPSEPFTPFTTSETYRRFSASASMTQGYLLARSPSAFRVQQGRWVMFTPKAGRSLQPYLPGQFKGEIDPVDEFRKKFGPFGQIELPKFAITPRGVECRVPVFEVDGYLIAVLLCESARDHLGLVLHPSNISWQDPSRPTYQVGVGVRTSNGRQMFGRLAPLGNDLYNLRFNGKTFKAEWRDLLIKDTPPSRREDDMSSVCAPLNCVAPSPPFRVPHWLIGRLAALGLNPTPLTFVSKPTDGNPLQARLMFEDISAKEAIRLTLGTCTNQERETSGPPPHWARVAIISSADWRTGADVPHDCDAHHVEKWDGLEKTFGDEERTVRLSFARCKITPDATLVLHLTLEGRVYEEMQRRSGVRIQALQEILREAMEELDLSSDD